MTDNKAKDVLRARMIPPCVGHDREAFEHAIRAIEERAAFTAENARLREQRATLLSAIAKGANHAQAVNLCHGRRCSCSECKFLGALSAAVAACEATK